MRNTILIIIAALSFTSCSAVKRNVSGAESLPTTEIRPITGQAVVHEDVTLQGEATEVVYFGIFRKGPDTYAILSGGGLGGVKTFKTGGSNSMKECALYDALKDTNYDIIVNPKYVISTNKTLFKKMTNVKVLGYAGSIEFD